MALAKGSSHLLSLYNIEEDPHLVGIELNVCCPNVTKSLSWEEVEEICRLYRESLFSKFGLILKLNYLQVDSFLINPISNAGFDAVSLNSIPVPPGGAYSGKLAQHKNWTSLVVLKRHDLKVVAPSIWSYGDINTVKALGADAVSFGSVHLLRPWTPSVWVKNFDKINQVGE